MDLYKGVDYESIVFAQKMESTPGTVWAYASAPVDLLSCIIEDVTGRTSGDFFNEEIGAALGAVPAMFPKWGSHSSGSGGPGGGVYFMPRELARVGYLLLHGGAWDGNRIISAERVAEFTQWAPFLDNAVWRQPNFGREANANRFYGYLFWTNRTQQSLGTAVPRDAYYMSGWGKQTCTVIPSLDLVVVRLGAHARLNEHPEFYPEFFARVMAAVVDRE